MLPVNRTRALALKFSFPLNSGQAESKNHENKSKANGKGIDCRRLRGVGGIDSASSGGGRLPDLCSEQRTKCHSLARNFAGGSAHHGFKNARGERFGTRASCLRKLQGCRHTRRNRFPFD